MKNQKTVKISPYLASFFFLPGESAAGLCSLLWPGVHVSISVDAYLHVCTLLKKFLKLYMWKRALMTF